MSPLQEFPHHSYSNKSDLVAMEGKEVLGLEEFVSANLQSLQADVLPTSLH